VCGINSSGNPAFSLWTTAPCFRGDEFTPAKEGAGVILLVLVFCNRYYFALHFIRTQRGALKTWPELVEGLFGGIVKKGGTLKPWPELVEGLFGGGLSRAMSYKLCGN